MPMSGDRVVDFAQMMIRHGKDSLLRQMDWKIIDDQETEIAALKHSILRSSRSQRPPVGAGGWKICLPFRACS